MKNNDFKTNLKKNKRVHHDFGHFSTKNRFKIMYFS